MAPLPDAATKELPMIKLAPCMLALAVALTSANVGFGQAGGQPAAPSGMATASVIVHLDRPAKAISPDLFGIFFEDLNYAADGGLYAELVQNRSFEYSPAEQLQWNAFTGWEVAARGNARGTARVDIGMPLHPNNPNYVVVQVTQAGDAQGGVGLVNTGYGGIPVTAGDGYDVSFFASIRTVGPRWGGPSNFDVPYHLTARLERADGTVLAEAPVEVSGRPWKRYAATLTATASEPNARLVLLAHTQGGVALDEISLFPKKTFKNRPNGLRADLAQLLADLKPKFVRFPGGCLVHGNGLPNLYRWKDTIGPTHERKGQPNLWGYHQSVGLGYFEYFQFCEDIGAAPLPVVAAGVSCQNSAQTAGTGQQGIPLDQMPAYVQDVLDLVEWANGPATSTWGAKRAAAGHPEPFGLKYLGVGNEDAITPEFRERYQMIQDAVRAKYPDVVVIGTVGPSPEGRDFNAGWKIADELKVQMVDEHYYQQPGWFLDNLTRYDGYDRSRSKVYVGEYASRGNAWSNALAEAAYLTGLERNGDVVHLASYAPLLAKIGNTQWNPDLIYFTNTGVFPTVNYQVQKLFSTNAGDRYVAADVTRTPAAGRGEALAVSAVRDTGSGDFVLKLVNVSPAAVRAAVELAGAPAFAPEGTRTVLAGNPRDQNNQASPQTVAPQAAAFAAAASFTYEAPPQSVTVFRFGAAR
jgi:alpha-L-arabinofuranosidase